MGFLPSLETVPLSFVPMMDGLLVCVCVCVCWWGGGSFSLLSTKLLLTAAASGVVAVPRVSSAHCRASV